MKFAFCLLARKEFNLDRDVEYYLWEVAFSAEWTMMRLFNTVNPVQSS